MNVLGITLNSTDCEDLSFGLSILLVYCLYNQNESDSDLLDMLGTHQQST